MPQLRPFQTQLKADVYAAWQRGARHVMAVSPTGSGKTVVFSSIIQDYRGGSIAVAHRQELVGQISLALARNGVRHRIVAGQNVARNCVQLHMGDIGRSYYDPSALCTVAGVDTLTRMPPEPWMQQVGLGIQDEAHHVLQGNKWGNAIELFPNAHWLGVTATCVRADGKGLGSHADGYFDTLVQAPGMRQLIEMGYLTDYRIFAPPSDIDLTAVPVGASGDYSNEPLRKAVHKSHIVGDVVQHYKRLAPGKLGVTFAVDVESASQIAQAYRNAGTPAEVVSAKTPDVIRATILRRFAARNVLQLVNVDLFGEGFDLPAIEVVSFARPTMSFGLYCQQFGRALRLMIDPSLMGGWDGYGDAERKQYIGNSSKPRAIIIDHVGNVHRHGLPDSYREWSLDRRERGVRNRSSLIPVRTCTACGSAYEATARLCPYCNVPYVPASRGTPAQVDGDLSELSPEALAKLRGQIDAPMRIPEGVAAYVAQGIANRHLEKEQARAALVGAMQQWAGYRTYVDGMSIDAAQRLFYFKYGIDVGTAQTLTRAEADTLRARVESGYQ